MPGSVRNPAHVRVVMPNPDRSRKCIHADGLPCSQSDREGTLVPADELLANEADLCWLCVSHHDLPDEDRLEALAAKPEHVLVFSQGDAFHRGDGGGTPRCRADRRGGGDREPREWPTDRAVAWRDACGHARCFGADAAVGGTSPDPVIVTGGGAADD